MHRAHTCEKATAYDKDGKEELAPGEYKPVPYGNSPVTWMQLDPNFMWPPACFSFRQSWSNWINQLRCERNVVAQWAAVVADLALVQGEMDGIQDQVDSELDAQSATIHSTLDAVKVNMEALVDMEIAKLTSEVDVNITEAAAANEEARRREGARRARLLHRMRSSR